MLPDNTYITLTCENPKTCPECGHVTAEFVVANEVIFDADGSFGIDAVVRHDPCGHVDPEADADPVTIAILTEWFEAMPEDDDGAQ
jgi:hypothetical protein